MTDEPKSTESPEEQAGTATETAGTTPDTLLTPMTLPASIGVLFIGVLALVVVKKAGQRPAFD